MWRVRGAPRARSGASVARRSPFSPGLKVSWVMLVDPEGEEGGVWERGRSPAAFYWACRSRLYKLHETRLLRIEHLNYATGRGTDTIREQVPDGGNKQGVKITKGGGKDNCPLGGASFGFLEPPAVSSRP